MKTKFFKNAFNIMYYKILGGQTKYRKNIRRGKQYDKEIKPQ